MGKHPLQRALRADKLTLAALEGTLGLYLDPARALREVPVLRMLAEQPEAVRARAERLAELVRGAVEETVARVGGGALPLAELPSFACAVEEQLAAPLRAGDPPVVARRPRRPLPARLPYARRRGARRGGSRGRGMPLTVGTAGHIDHGKTWLVRALTGKDTDRLPEEQCRGISIDLGYAPLELPDGRRLSLVDVPGHERFVRNMVAGATGIDLFLLVIDAAEGARPQTHEHLAILRLLGIERGVVAVTKADAVDEETLELAVEEARELVPEAEVVAVSAKTGTGLDELRSALAAVADEVERSHPEGPARLYVDRVFTLRGIGTVVTGTLWSGTIGEGDELRVEPAGIDVRVRSVQVHDRARRRARRPDSGSPSACRGSSASGCPAATRSSRRMPIRSRTGSTCCSRSSTRCPRRSTSTSALPTSPPAWRAAAALPSSASSTRSSPPGGTASSCGRPRPSAAASCSTRCRRDGSTPSGSSSCERGDVAATVHEPVRASALRHLASSPASSAPATGSSRANGSTSSATTSGRGCAGPIRSDPGIDAPAAPWAAAVVPLLGVERRGSRLYLPGAKAEAAGGEELLAELEAAGANPVKVGDPKLGRLLEQEGKLVRLGDGLAVGRDAYERARETLVAECSSRRLDHDRPLPGPARRRPPHSAAAARALRRGRAHPSCRRRARPAPRRAQELLT